MECLSSYGCTYSQHDAQSQSAVDKPFCMQQQKCHHASLLSPYYMLYLCVTTRMLFKK